MSFNGLLDAETPMSSMVQPPEQASSYSRFAEVRKTQQQKQQHQPPPEREEDIGPLGSPVHSPPRPPPRLSYSSVASPVHASDHTTEADGGGASGALPEPQRRVSSGLHGREGLRAPEEPALRPHTARPRTSPAEQSLGTPLRRGDGEAHSEEETEAPSFSTSSPLLSLPPMVPIAAAVQRQQQAPVSAPPSTFLSFPPTVPGLRERDGEEGPGNSSDSKVVHVPQLTLVDVKAASAENTARPGSGHKGSLSAKKASSNTSASRAPPMETSDTLMSTWDNMYALSAHRRSSTSNTERAPAARAKEESRNDYEMPYDFFDGTNAEAEDDVAEAIANNRADADGGSTPSGGHEKRTRRSSNGSRSSSGRSKETAKKTETQKEKTKRSRQDMSRAKRLSTAPDTSCLYTSSSAVLPSDEKADAAPAAAAAAAAPAPAGARAEPDDTMKRIVQDALRRRAEQAEASASLSPHTNSRGPSYSTAAPHTPTMPNGSCRKRVDSDKKGGPANTFITATGRLNAAIKEQKRQEPKHRGSTPVLPDGGGGGSLSLDSSMVAPSTSPHSRGTPNRPATTAAVPERETGAASTSASASGSGGGKDRKRRVTSPPLFSVPTFLSKTPMAKDPAAAAAAAAQKEEVSDKNDVSSSNDELNDNNNNANHNNPFTTMSFKRTSATATEEPQGLLSPTLLSTTNRSRQATAYDALVFENSTQTAYPSDGTSQDSAVRRRRQKGNGANTSSASGGGGGRKADNKSNEASMQGSVMFGNTSVPSSFFQIIADSRRHNASNFHYNTAEMMSLTSEGNSKEATSSEKRRREADKGKDRDKSKDKEQRKDRSKEKEKSTSNNNSNTTIGKNNTDTFTSFSDMAGTDGIVSDIPHSNYTRREANSSDDGTILAPFSKVRPPPAAAAASAPVAATPTTTTKPAAAATSAKEKEAKATTPTPTPTPTTNTTTPSEALPSDSSHALPLETSGSQLLDFSYEYQNPSSTSNYRTTATYDMAEEVHEARSRNATAAAAAAAAAAAKTEKEAAYILHEVIDDLDEESSDSEQDGESESSSGDDDVAGADGADGADGRLGREVERFKKVNKIYSGGGGVSSVDLLRPRRILNLHDFRKFFLPESFLYETEMTMHYEAPAAAASPQKRPVAAPACRDYNIEVFKVKERNSQRRYAAHVIYSTSSSPPLPSSPTAESASSGSGSNGMSDLESKTKRRMTPLMKQECALALLLRHQHVLHTYDILVDADEDKQEVLQEAQRLSQLLFPKEKDGSEVPLPITIVPNARGSSGGVSFITSPQASKTKRRPAEPAAASKAAMAAVTTATPRDQVHQPALSRPSSAEGGKLPSGGGGGGGPQGKEDPSYKKLAALTQNVQYGHVVYMLITELASPFDFLLHCVPPRKNGGGSGGSSGRRQKSLTLSADEAAHLVHDAAAGLQYLHTLPPAIASNYFVLHGSLAPHSIMLDVNHRLKLCCLSTSGWGSYNTKAAGSLSSSAMPIFYNAALDTFLAPELYTPVQQRLQQTVQQLGERRGAGSLPCLNGFFLLSPAAVKRTYRPAIDVWALGAFLYRLVVGEQPGVLRRAPPSPGAPTPCEVCLVRKKKKTGLKRLQTKSRRQRKMEYLVAHPDLLDLLQRMLCVDPAKRITITEALAHPFLKEKK